MLFRKKFRISKTAVPIIIKISSARLCSSLASSLHKIARPRVAFPGFFLIAARMDAVEKAKIMERIYASGIGRTRTTGRRGACIWLIKWPRKSALSDESGLRRVICSDINCTAERAETSGPDRTQPGGRLSTRAVGQWLSKAPTVVGESYRRYAERQILLKSQSRRDSRSGGTYRARE